MPLEELAHTWQALPERVEFFEEAIIPGGLVHCRDRTSGTGHLHLRDTCRRVAGAQKAEHGAIGGLGCRPQRAGR